MKTKKITDTFNRLPMVAQIAIVGAVGFGIWKGIKWLRNRPTTYNLPQGGSGIPVTGYTPTGQPIAWNPEPLVDELHDVMSGLFTLTGSKDAAWQKLINLPSNDMLTATYNRFNTKWGDGNTLTQWIRDENYYDYFTGVKDQAINRLTSAGLN